MRAAASVRGGRNITKTVYMTERITERKLKEPAFGSGVNKLAIGENQLKSEFCGAG